MEQESLYQTGDTQPPKSNRGIIALLLITIVILGSITTLLGLLNIQLFRKLKLQTQDPDSLHFAQIARTEQANADTNPLGLSVKTLSAFDQNFYHLPQGVYITDVRPGSRADKQGVMPGDILISIQNIPITDESTLETYLDTCIQGQLLSGILVRNGKRYSVYFTVGE